MSISLLICLETTPNIGISLICTHYYIKNAENIWFDTLILWVWLWLHDPSSIHLVHWSSFCYFFFNFLLLFAVHTNSKSTWSPIWDVLCDASVSSSSSPYHPSLAMIRSSPPRLPCSNLSIIDPWGLHLDQYTPKVINLYLRTIWTFFAVFFALMPLPNSIDLTSPSPYWALET